MQRGCLVWKVQKTGHKFYEKKIPLFPRIIHFFMRIFFSCSIPPKVIIGDNVRFAHNALGVVIHDDAIIGEGSVILQNVTIGGKNGQKAPQIGANCFLGAGCCVLGEIVLGDDVIVGANAVVTHDVPNGKVVAGVPARIISEVSKDMLGYQKK